MPLYYWRKQDGDVVMQKISESIFLYGVGKRQELKI